MKRRQAMNITSRDCKNCELYGKCWIKIEAPSVVFCQHWKLKEDLLTGKKDFFGHESPKEFIKHAKKMRILYDNAPKLLELIKRLLAELCYIYNNDDETKGAKEILNYNTNIIKTIEQLISAIEKIDGYSHTFLRKKD